MRAAPRRVQDVVLNTPGARELLANLADLPAGPRRIAIACAGGKHRAGGLTELLARELRDRQGDVEHLHIHLPRVLTTTDPTRTTTEQEPPMYVAGIDGAAAVQFD
ncbi:hypothetical protein ACWC0C_42260 [Streptomyces sp. NPDC001709]